MRSASRSRVAILFAAVVALVLAAGSAYATFCRGILDNHAYQCWAQSEKGEKFPLYLNFYDPGPVGTKFSVFVNHRAGACSCEVKRTYVNGKEKITFNASNSFHCYVPGFPSGSEGGPEWGGPDESGSDFLRPSCSGPEKGGPEGSGGDSGAYGPKTFLIDFASYSGLAVRVNKSTTKITKGEAVDACGRAIVFKCTQAKEMF
jgi:hypothetical protein